MSVFQTAIVYGFIIGSSFGVWQWSISAGIFMGAVVMLAVAMKWGA